MNWIYFLKVIDATGKIPSGLSNGVLTSFGDYDQCLNVVSPEHVGPSMEPIRGKYCLVRPYIAIRALEQLENITGFSFLNNKTNSILMKDWKKNMNLIKVLATFNVRSNDKFYLFHHGVCISSKCSITDLQNIINKSE